MIGSGIPWIKIGSRFQQSVLCLSALPLHFWQHKFALFCRSFDAASDTLQHIFLVLNRSHTILRSASATRHSCSVSLCTPASASSAFNSSHSGSDSIDSVQSSIGICRSLHRRAFERKGASVGERESKSLSSTSIS